MKTFEIFAKIDCPYCKKTINLLSLKGWPFVVTIVDKNPEFLEKTKETWNWPTLPIVIVSQDGNKTLLGGASELEDFINEQSAPTL